MHALPSRAPHRALVALVALAGTSLLLSSGAVEAPAQTKSVHLRVEGQSRTLEPGRGYVAGAVRTQRGRGDDCRRRQGRPRFSGATPIGALGLAANHNRRLRPQRMRLTDLGWQLCGIRSDLSFGAFPGDFGGWLYRVNHESGFAAIDEARLGVGDQVLLVYAVFPGAGSATEPRNNGRELALRRVPTRVRPGQSFTVRVVAFDDAGNPEAVTSDGDIEVRGGDSPAEPDAKGFAEVTISEPGTSRLRAVHTQAREGEFGPEHDIASERMEVCARPNQSNCPRARGTLIRGSHRADRIRATRGDDAIRARAGNDLINLRPGGRNRVFCGRGRDTVIINRGERRRNTLRNCERIVRRGGRAAGRTPRGAR